MATKEKTKAVAVLKQEVIKVINPEVFEATVQEIEAIVIEKAFIWEGEKLDCYWRVGEALRDSEKLSKANITALIKKLADDNRMKNVHLGERMLWACVKAFDTFKKKDGVIDWPGGKAATWTKIKAVLMDPAKPKEPSMRDVAVRLFKKYGVEAVKELVAELQQIMKHEGRNS